MRVNSIKIRNKNDYLREMSLSYEFNLVNYYLIPKNGKSKFKLKVHTHDQNYNTNISSCCNLDHCSIAHIT